MSHCAFCLADEEAGEVARLKAFVSRLIRQLSEQPRWTEPRQPPRRPGRYLRDDGDQQVVSALTQEQIDFQRRHGSFNRYFGPLPESPTERASPAPCPFCGESPGTRTLPGGQQGITHRNLSCVLDGLGTHVPVTVKDWNRRAEKP